MHAQQREAYEPVDKPVRLYETALFLAAQLLTIAALSTHFPAVELAAAASMALLIALSMGKLMVPPRFSATRGAFVLMGFIYLFLLWHP